MGETITLSARGSIKRLATQCRGERRSPLRYLFTQKNSGLVCSGRRAYPEYMICFFCNINKHINGERRSFLCWAANGFVQRFADTGHCLPLKGVACIWYLRSVRYFRFAHREHHKAHCFLCLNSESKVGAPFRDIDMRSRAHFLSLRLTIARHESRNRSPS